MSTELSHALLSVIQKASETAVEGPTALRARRMKGASSATVVLADVSPSMVDVIGSSGLRKFDHLKIALQDVLKYHPNIRVVAFASQARDIKNLNALPECGRALGGGTNLGDALRHIHNDRPRKTIIISDGLPDSESDATLAADILTGQIDTIYCGPDSHPAAAFLQGLSKRAGGESVVWDGYRDGIAPAIRALIG